MFCFGSFSPPYYFGQVISLIENVIIPVEVASSPTATSTNVMPPRARFNTQAMLMDHPQGELCFSEHWNNSSHLEGKKCVCVCFLCLICGTAGWVEKKKKREMFFRACVLFCQGVLDDVSLVMVRSDPGGCFIRYPSINSCNIHLHQPDQSSFPPKMSTPALHQPSSCPSLLQSLSSWFFHLH